MERSGKLIPRGGRVTHRVHPLHVAMGAQGNSAFQPPNVTNGTARPQHIPPSCNQPPAPTTSGVEDSSQFTGDDIEDTIGKQDTPIGDLDVQASMYPDNYFSDLIAQENNEQAVVNEFGISSQSSHQAPSYEQLNDDSALGRSNQKRSKNFTEEEDVLLVSAWINISVDPINGNNQGRNTYWGRIYDYFHTHRTFYSDRSQKSLTQRWQHIQEAVNRFSGCLSRKEARRQSGITVQDKLVQAQSLFKSEDANNKAFGFMHCWNELRNQQKWIDKERVLAAPKVINKKQKAVTESTPPKSNPSNGQDVDSESPEYNISERPPGVKRAKASLRQGRDDRFVAAVDMFLEKKKVVDDERFSQLYVLEKERVETDKELRQKEVAVKEREVAVRDKEAAAREKEAAAREEAETRSKDVDRKHLIDEERIMTLDLSSMPGQLQEYYTRLKEEIMNRRFGV